MKTFSNFIVEAAGSGFAQMSDTDFEGWVKENPSAAEKAQQVRAKFKQTYNQAQQSAGGAKPLVGGTKPSTGTRPGLKMPNFRNIPRPTARQAAVGALNVGMGALDYKARRDVGQTRTQAGSGAVASTIGGQAGWMTGAKLGAALPIAHPIAKGAAVLGLGLVGNALGSEGASRMSDKLTGVTKPSEREKLSRQAINKGQGLTGLNRARQTADIRDTRKASTAYGTKQGSTLTGIGGPTTVNKQAGTLTSKGRTVKLAATQLVRDPRTGQQRVGDLAYKGGKAVYLARPSVASRDTSLAANIGRALNIGSYSKAAEQQAAKQEYRTALKNTQAYTKGLGVSTQSATRQGLPGYGSKPAPAPKPKPKPSAKGTLTTPTTGARTKSQLIGGAK